MDNMILINRPLSVGDSSLEPLFIAPNKIQGNNLKGTGVFIKGDAFQAGSIFKTTVPKTFQSQSVLDSMSQVISSESEKQTTISNMNKFIGHYSEFSGNFSVDMVNEMKVSHTSLAVFKQVTYIIGTYNFDYENSELSDIIKKILDPTSPGNKDPEKYKQHIRNFLSEYGYYYISSYELYGSIIGSWSITTDSIESKSKLTIDLGAKVSGGNYSFEDVNTFIKESASSFKNTTTTFQSLGIGFSENIQTIEQVDKVYQDFASIVNEQNAAISKVFISPWTTLSQIADYLLLIDDPQLHHEVKGILDGSDLNQDIWDSSFNLLGQFYSTRNLIQNSIHDPYNNQFWGFLVDYSHLPIQKIKDISTQIDQMIQVFHQFDAATFGQQFLDFKNKYMPLWDKLSAELISYTSPPVFEGTVESGFYQGDATRYSLYQGAKIPLTFDPKRVTLNQEILRTPVQRQYLAAILTNVWHQGVISFQRINTSDKFTCPFVLHVKCLASWTLHNEWDSRGVDSTYNGKTETIDALARYDTSYAGFECNALVNLSLKRQ